jgi:hypothetical protein
MAEDAVDMVVPAINFSLKRHAKRVAGHLRVSHLVDGNWCVITTRDFGQRDTWEYDYEGHATAKEELSQRTGKATRDVQSKDFELLEQEDTVYFGSVVSPGGTIVVAFSGVEAHYDEMFAKWVLAACLGLIEHELERQRNAGVEYYER